MTPTMIVCVFYLLVIRLATVTSAQNDSETSIFRDIFNVLNTYQSRQYLHRYPVQYSPDLYLQSLQQFLYSQGLGVNNGANGGYRPGNKIRPNRYGYNQQQNIRPGGVNNGLIQNLNNILRPNEQYNDQSLSGLISQSGSNIMNALTSIARYDTLKCVPRLLCEMASGRNTYQRNNKDYPSSSLSSIDFKQFLSLIEGISNGREPTPLFLFGRAALLGYSSNGNPYDCWRAYPECPRDYDQLINYLNNHNGGFFRFFNQGSQNYPGQSYLGQKYPGQNIPNQNYPSQNYQNQKYPVYNQNIGSNRPYYKTNNGNKIQRRILTKPGPYRNENQQNNIYGSNNYNDNNLFSNHNDEYKLSYVKKGKTVIFPEQQKKVSVLFPDNYEENYHNNHNSRPIRTGSKSIKFNNEQQRYQYNILGGVIPDISLVKINFPDRTGTGELILDSELFNNE